RGDGDRDPVRAVVQLVLQLVHGLLQLEDGQQLAHRVLPRWKQAWFYCPEVAIQERAAGQLLPAVGRRPPAEDGRGGRHVGEDALDLLVDRRRDQRDRLGPGLLRRERRVAGVRAERGVHPAADLAEGAQSLEEALRRRCHLAQRELPAVLRSGQEALEDPQRR